MSAVDVVLVSALAVSLLSAVFLALAEASLLRIGKFRVAGLAQAGDRRAVRVSHLLERLPEVLNLILFLARMMILIRCLSRSLFL